MHLLLILAALQLQTARATVADKARLVQPRTAAIALHTTTFDDLFEITGATPLRAPEGITAALLGNPRLVTWLSVDQPFGTQSLELTEPVTIVFFGPVQFLEISSLRLDEADPWVYCELECESVSFPLYPWTGTWLVGTQRLYLFGAAAYGHCVIEAAPGVVIDNLGIQ